MFSPAFQFYPKQWLGDDSVMLMDFDAQGMHLHLMCIAWQQDEPCSLPNDDDMLRRWCHHCDAETWDRVKPQIMRAWRIEGDRIHQDGLLKELDKQQDKREKTQGAANARWKKHRQKQLYADASSSHMQNECITEVEVEVENTSPKTKFIPPTLEEIREEIKVKNYTIDAEKFYYFYDGKDWMIGKNKMKRWKSCLATWKNSSGSNPKDDDSPDALVARLAQYEKDYKRKGLL